MRSVALWALAASLAIPASDHSVEVHRSDLLRDVHIDRLPSRGGTMSPSAIAALSRKRARQRASGTRR